MCTGIEENLNLMNGFEVIFSWFQISFRGQMVLRPPRFGRNEPPARFCLGPE